MFRQKVLLKFNENFSYNMKGKHVREGLSSALRTGNNLWTCCDERNSLERLTLLDDGSFGNHKHYDLNQFLTIPANSECEIDIEGIGIEKNKYLWIVGSHSLTRKKPRKNDPPEKQIKRLTKVTEDPNRYVLARIPFVIDAVSGNYELVKTTSNLDSAAKSLNAAQLIYVNDRNQLMEILGEDDHFKRFMKIPGKDNGFDIEGLAVNDNKIFLGVRGPVLRGWAIILELEVNEVNDGWLEIAPDKDGKYYKKHFVQLEGMGVRDLRIVENDLLILAGPTMDLDGTIAVYRWRNALHTSDDSIVHRKDLERLFDVPHGHGETSGQDKAEGMALYDSTSILIVFDTPTSERMQGSSAVFGDLYQLTDPL